MSGDFQLISSELKFQGRIATVSVERFRHADGEEVTREKVAHPGAVGILALDQGTVWLTRQPREVVGARASLEIPAGKLDVEGEAPLATAQRELAEEIGLQARLWEEVQVFYTSPGFSDERVWLYLATELSEADGEYEAEENERIEIVRWPLNELDSAIAECDDSKTLIALLWLRAERQAGARFD